MIPLRLDVDAFLKELGDDHGGKSRPLLVMGSDQKPYILKTQNTSEGNWNAMFLHELLVAQIAEFLDISTPECAIMNVDDIFLNKAPSLRFNSRFSAGLHFASGYINDTENNLKKGYLDLLNLRKPHIKRSWSSFFDGISNPEVVPRIIVLDLLTANFDRFGNSGNLLIAPLDGSRSIIAIDHGHCFFSPIWDSSKMNLLRMPEKTIQYVNIYLGELSRLKGNDGALSGLGQVFRALERHIDISDAFDHPFLSVVHKINQINEHIVDSWFSKIPDAWYVDKQNQIAYYKHFLLNQREVMTMLIDHLALLGAFTNHNGGVLEWIEKPTGTQ